MAVTSRAAGLGSNVRRSAFRRRGGAPPQLTAVWEDCRLSPSASPGPPGRSSGPPVAGGPGGASRPASAAVTRAMRAGRRAGITPPRSNRGVVCCWGSQASRRAAIVGLDSRQRARGSARRRAPLTGAWAGADPQYPKRSPITLTGSWAELVSSLAVRFLCALSLSRFSPCRVCSGDASGLPRA